MKLNRNFYNRNTLIVAKELLGKTLVHNINGHILKGKIVETEAYLGFKDKAAHSYGGKKTKRVETMYGLPGKAYVYIIYGMYYCFNIVTEEEGIPEAVLIRGVEPLCGIEQMALNRYEIPYENLTKYQNNNLTNGPGKLSMAFSIDKTLDKEDLCKDKLYIEKGKEDKIEIIETARIGIDYAQEARDYPYRFYIKGNKYVSKTK